MKVNKIDHKMKYVKYFYFSRTPAELTLYGNSKMNTCPNLPY